jgi:hypothetical protein
MSFIDRYLPEMSLGNTHRSIRLGYGQETNTRAGTYQPICTCQQCHVHCSPGPHQSFGPSGRFMHRTRVYVGDIEAGFGSPGLIHPLVSTGIKQQLRRLNWDQQIQAHTFSGRNGFRDGSGPWTRANGIEPLLEPDSLEAAYPVGSTPRLWWQKKT